MTTYYVSTSGSDSASGTSSAPWRTIQHAANTVNAGDIVYVMGGTYNEKITISRSGTSTGYITFSANPGATVTIDGSSSGVGYWDGLVRITGSYIIFQNFNVVNSGWAGIYVSNANFVTIQGNYIAQTQSSGVLAATGGNYKILNNELYHTSGYICGNGQSQESISVQYSVDGFEVAYNYLHDVGLGGGCGAEGIDVKNGVKNGSVHHNSVINAQSVSIYVDAFGLYSDNVDVYNNYVSGGSAGIAVSAEDGGTANGVRIYNNIIINAVVGIRLPAYDGSSGGGTLKNIAVTNNTIYYNGWSISGAGGIWIGQYSQTYIDTLTIRNNIISQNYQYQIQESNTGRHTNIVADHNLFYGAGGTYGTYAVTGNPLFVSSSDFHLQSGSPAINAGSSTQFVPSFDYDNYTRPIGTYYDIGAYEYGSGTACPSLSANLLVG